MRRYLLLLLLAIAATAAPTARYPASVNDEIDRIWTRIVETRKTFDASDQAKIDVLTAQEEIAYLQADAFELLAKYPKTRAPRVLVDLLSLFAAHYAGKSASLDYLAAGQGDRWEACNNMIDELEKPMLPLCDELIWCYRHQW